MIENIIALSFSSPASHFFLSLYILSLSLSLHILSFSFFPLFYNVLLLFSFLSFLLFLSPSILYNSQNIYYTISVAAAAAAATTRSCSRATFTDDMASAAAPAFSSSPFRTCKSLNVPTFTTSCTNQQSKL